ncbi:hypothetical protein [Flavobacterium granuli]|uniref:Uncharacterized protein n=1 Tax=Flavobacterium granuli TaxID=280093 RepID=A0A1M5MFS2_9FLAO|nr:hypothetical protein [Flavobacterium granuli]PRZ24940.1 hypothetical protein BC624_10310 [Flavobacterium granuli]SHG76096.1 hypothetical protein SAMN05443373_1049 [Flavobacterium granuli]
MKAIEFSQQKELETAIKDHIKTAAIYCFGKRVTTYSSNHTIYPDKGIQKKHTHLYLLVLVEETIENATNDISDKIKTKTDGSITVTLLIHQLGNLKKMYDDQQYFFWSIMQNSELLFQDAYKPPYLITNGTPKRNLKLTSLYAANRKNNISTIWSWVYNDDEVNSSDEVKMSGLHQIVEQTCLSLIRVFLGYTPNHFSLDYLFNLCEYFTAISTELFPRKTREDQSMFKLLKQQPSALRFSKANDVDYLYYQLLERRCTKFKNEAEVLIQKELDRLKEIENKQD